MTDFEIATLALQQKALYAAVAIPVVAFVVGVTQVLAIVYGIRQMRRAGDQREEREDHRHTEVMAAVEQQGEAFRRQGEAFQQQGEALRQQGEALRQQGEALRQQGETLRQQGESLREQNETLRQQSEVLGAILERVAV